MNEDKDGFESYMRGNYQRLLRLAYLLCGDSFLADDLVQVTLTKVALRWPRLRQADGIDHYVRRAMINNLTSMWRKRPFRVGSLSGVDVADRRDAPGEIDQRDELRQLLAALPGRQRAAVVLRHYAGLSEAETAEALACSVGNVKALTSKGLQSLRVRLAQDSDTTIFAERQPHGTA